MDIPQLRQKYEDINLDTLMDVIDEVVVRKGGKRSRPLDPSPNAAPAPAQTELLASVPCWGRTPSGDRCPRPRVPDTDWCREHTKHVAQSAPPGEHAAPSQPRQPRHERVERRVERVDFFEPPEAPNPAADPSDPFVQTAQPATTVPIDAEPGLGDRRCGGLTKASQPCRAAPLRGGPYCLNHDPSYAQHQRRNARVAGRASGASRRGIPEMTNSEFVNLIDRSGVQAAIDAMFRLELFGKIPAARSRVFVRLLSLAVRNFDRAQSTTPDGQLADPPRATHDEQVFTNSRLGFNDYSAHVVSALVNAELSRRVQEIEDFGAKRQEYLKTNDMWAPHEPLNQASRAYLTPFHGA